MMRHNRAAALVHDGRMRNTFRIADIHDVPDDVVGVFLQRVIGRTVEIASRSVVIDTESAADIEIPQFVAELGQF